MKRLLLLTMLLPFLSFGQLIGTNKDGLSLQYSPKSVKVWGKTENAARVSIQYDILELVYVRNSDNIFNGKELPEEFAINKDNFGIFVNPIHYEWKGLRIQLGAGWFMKKLPDLSGANLTFQAELRYMFTRNFGVFYKHNSNGFGLLNDWNPGLDNIGFVFKL